MPEYQCEKDCLTLEERAKIMSRFHSLLFWVGEFVPELEELEGRSPCERWCSGSSPSSPRTRRR